MAEFTTPKHLCDNRPAQTIVQRVCQFKPNFSFIASIYVRDDISQNGGNQTPHFSKTSFLQRQLFKLCASNHRLRQGFVSAGRPDVQGLAHGQARVDRL
ncbi:MAG: hypothetical protein KGI86_14885, partial [Betaproteobacteria bacterium]|nr:hypothetical protein [Betaproteobacteria bacterium]